MRSRAARSPLSSRRSRPLRSTSSLLFALAATLCGCVAPGTVKPGAKTILEAFQPPSPEQAARWAINPYNADDRYRGTLILAQQSFGGEPVYIQLFVDNSDDPDPGVRAVSTRALGNHGRPEHVPLILLRLKDEDVGVRIEAARALQRVHNSEAVPDLLDAIDIDNESETRVRLEAATALGQYRENRVVEGLISALADSDLAVNTRVRDALTTLTGQDFGFGHAEWQAWYRRTQDLFAAGAGYTYPVFSRGRFWYEYIPLIPQPPNESPSIPAGFSPQRPVSNGR